MPYNLKIADFFCMIYPVMTVKGYIERPPDGRDEFTIPDPKESGGIMSARLQIQPGIWRKILWAPSHMISEGAKGAGRAYLKFEQVGAPIDTANLPANDATDTLTDAETGTVIHLTRTR